jgi:hypothetical protein
MKKSFFMMAVCPEGACSENQPEREDRQFL